ncbi:hypothetical protein L1278_002980 [Pontibacter sp. HSC-36F09]|nr:DUF4082 domain-containing protein [Pontibacter sp. HSC-36F09]MCP2044919.1 hypothetical protein [Pontibacter sp. HSC-36F09]
MGYYQGNGARFQGNATVTAALPQSQPNCLTNSSTGLVDCGNWAESASWAIPNTAVSGIYIAKLTRTDTGGSSHITFIVRKDDSSSDLFFQTADATWQAYNIYGDNNNGKSLYTGSGGKAVKVSYNRPFITRNGGGGGGPQEDWLFNAEYPMIRWLEANGYDVTYTTNVDSDRRGNLIKNHKVFLSVGHDEYWSGVQRAHVTAARNAGTHLAFFSGNEVYWKTRWENSIDGSGKSHRTLVCYKEGGAGENTCTGKCDPSPEWTGLWRSGCEYRTGDQLVDGCNPENELTGQISWEENTAALQVPSTYSNLRFWRNTSIASLGSSQTATLTNGIIGYEWNSEQEQYRSTYPSGRIILSRTIINGKTHHLSLYKHSSGALVFGAGTVQYSWGLDSNHDRGSAAPSVALQQATINLFADMSVQPGTPRPGMVAATASTDTQAPTTVITSPAEGTNLANGVAITIRGTAADANTVAGVEVSTDGGATWRLATGTTSWSLNWTLSGSGPASIRSRAFDDSGNLSSPAVVNVSIGGTTTPVACPCSVFPTASAPTGALQNDGQALQLGMKFRASTNGFVTGVRFYKQISNTGTHTGQLYSSTGSLLATVTFSNETSTGWQQANFASPVAVTAGTTYIISYHSSAGNYSADDNGFNQAIINGPLTGLQSGTDGANGVYSYTAAPAFPTSSFSASNYWVDVVFNTASSPGNQPPVVSITSPANNASFTAPASVAIAASASDSDGSIARVEFFNSPTKLGEDADGSNGWSFAWNNVPAGTYQLTARATDNAGATTTSGTVAIVMNAATNQAPTVSLTSPANNASFTAPATISMASSASDADGTVSKVEFYQGTTKLGEDLTSPYTYTWNSVAPGTYQLTARVTDSGGATATSTVINITVTSNNQAPVVSLNSPANSATFKAPATITIAATASDTDGSVTRVEFFRGETKLGEDLSSPYSYTWGNVAAGSYQITARATDNTDAVTTSAAVNVTVSPAPSGCPCTVFQPTAIPVSNLKNDGRAIQVGMKFRSTVNGLVTGVRFYKYTGNTGTHTGQLHTSNGTLLASITFRNETTSGWQQATFASPVAVTAGTTYVVSYHSSAGNYTSDYNYFSQAVVNGPLRALVNGESGVNGVYRYTNSPAFPSVGFQSSNYWVDVVFNTDSPPANQLPTVSITSPANNATFTAPASVTIAAAASDSDGTITKVEFFYGVTKLGEDVDGGNGWSYSWQNVAAGTHQLSAKATDNSGGVTTSSPVSIAVNAANQAPTVAITSPANNATFTVPATIALAASASDTDGSIEKVEFYSGSTKLGEDFTSPYTYTWTGVTAGSYEITARATDNGGAFTTSAAITINVNSPANVPPTITITSPANNATFTAPGSIAIAATASDQDGTVTKVEFYNGVTKLGEDLASPYSFAWRNVVAGNYTLSARATDNSGAVTTSAIVSVTVNAATSDCPCTVFQPNSAPNGSLQNDGNALQLGMKFQSSAEGFVTGIRFYKQSGNSGTHTGQLYSITGTLMASVTFANETASGWQEASFASPVAITAGTTYVISYHSSAGYYSVDDFGFSQAVVNGSLTGLRNDANEANGIYRYTNSPAFPNSNYASSNYWVDVVFNTSNAFTNQTQSSTSASALSTNSRPAGNLSEDKNQPAMHVFPNPSLGEGVQVEVTGLGNSEDFTLTLFSSVGSKVASFNMKTDVDGGFTEDLKFSPSLPYGVYTFRLQSKSHTLTQTIVINR